MSDTEQDRRIEDLDRANSVLKTVCEEYASFIADVRPLALNHGTVYHIGTSAKVYKRGMAVGDLGWDSLGGVSTRLSVAEDERIWTIGKGNWVWTGFGDEKNWKKTSITAEDIWVVKQGLETSGGKGSLSDIYTIEDGKFCWRVWDETIGVDARTPEPARWEKFVPVPGAPHALGGKKYTADGPLANIKFQQVVATADGTVYLLGQAGGGNPLRVWCKSTYPYAVELVYPPTLADPLDSCRGIAINNDQFYVITKDKINCTDHEGITKPHEWKTIGGPTGTNKDWSYNQLFASEDGALLVTVNQKIYFWAGKGWEPNKDKASAVRLFRLPVLGWELFEAVEDLVEVARKLPSGISTGVVS